LKHLKGIDSVRFFCPSKDIFDGVLITINYPYSILTFPNPSHVGMKSVLTGSLGIKVTKMSKRSERERAGEQKLYLGNP